MSIDSMTHVCICGVEFFDHREECYVQDERYRHPDGDYSHSHYPPLCCDNCPCLSFEEAHPAAVGTPLERLPEILHSITLSTRTRQLLADHGVRTVERLDSVYLQTVANWHGFGRVRLREVILTTTLWRAAVRRGDAVAKSLPELEVVR